MPSPPRVQQVGFTPDDRATTSKYEARRNEIVDLAAALFARNSYAATGVAEISVAAQLGKGGLYYYIGSKEALLVEIHERVMQPLLAASTRIASLEASPLVRLRLVSEALLRVIIERRDHVWVVLHEYRALKGELLESFRSRRRQFEDVVAGLFAEGQVAGLFRIEDRRLTTLAFLGMHNSTYQWVQPGGRLDPLDISRLYCAMFFEGVGMRAGVADTDAAVARLRPSLDAVE